jgi:ATP-binding cassette, subfamily B (MDR/TAP), member 10
MIRRAGYSSLARRWPLTLAGASSHYYESFLHPQGQQNLRTFPRRHSRSSSAFSVNSTNSRQPSAIPKQRRSDDEENDSSPAAVVVAGTSGSAHTAAAAVISCETTLPAAAAPVVTPANSTADVTTNIARLLEMSRSEWPLIGMSASTLAVTSSVTLLLPYASGSVIDYTITSGGGDGVMSPLVLASGLFGLSALAGGGVYLRSLWLARAGNRIVARLKQRLYASVLKQESAFLDRQTTGDVLSRLTSDAQLVQGALTTQAVAGLRATVMSVGAGGMLLYTSPLLALVSCATLPPVFIMSRYVGRHLNRQQEEVQRLLGEATSVAEQALNHPSTVKQFTAENFEAVRYRNSVALAHTKSVETAHMQAQLEAGAHISGNAAILGVLGIGGTMVLEGSITAGDLTGFVMYSLLLAGNLSSLTGIYSDLVRAVAASTRILDLVDRTPQIPSVKSTEQEKHIWEDGSSGVARSVDPLAVVSLQAEQDRGMSVIDGAATVEFKNLSFRYPSRPDVPVLDNFSLTVPSGSVVALVGKSGSGKSTIASLLTRLYDVEHNMDEEAPIRINGKSIRDYDPQDLRQMISVVSQDPVLFRGTIRDNIRYGMWDKVSDDDVVEAARQAHVMDFATKFADGLDTMVGPRGMSVSGGQRQRISIARMLANKNAPILILDEVRSVVFGGSARAYSCRLLTRCSPSFCNLVRF